MISRTFIHDFGHFKLCGEHFIKLNLNVLHSPKSNLIVYYVDEYKNLTIQSYEINVNNIFENKMEMNFDKNSSEPGNMVKLDIKTDPYSIVAVCGIDKSLEDPEKSNEFTDDIIKKQIFEQQLTPYYRRSERNSLDIVYFYERNRIFESKGLILLTDLSSLKENSKLFLYNLTLTVDNTTFSLIHVEYGFKTYSFISSLKAKNLKDNKKNKKPYEKEFLDKFF